MSASRAAAALVAAMLLPACASRSPAASPVAWQEWSPATFARAKAEDRLLVVDVVASWCHWCHVMDKTTYADAEVVAALGADYVAIRVDSDARPDVAERYREWGWPATAILTPDARPVTELRGYQEPAAFAELLRSTAADVRAGRAVERRAPAPRPAGDADLAALRDRVDAQLARAFDAEQAGWGRPQKYPLAAPVEQGFLATWLTGDAEPRRRSLATLERELALLDPVWGGMYQYSTHGDWEHPHFEKIATVQAGALGNFAEAFAATGDARWRDAATSVARYVREFLTAPDGAFGTSQDADVGSHDGPAWIDGHDYFPLADAERRAKGVPRVDTSVYADLNGLLVQGLCAFGVAARDREALAAARRAALRVAKSHAAPLGGFTHGEASAAGAVPILHLADQVAMGRAFLALAEATGEAGFIARADTLAQTLLDRFEDKPAGGFFAHTLDRTAVGVFAERQKPFDENARAARFLLRLAHTTGEELLREAAERALRAFADPEVVASEGRAVGDYLIALDELAHPPLHFNVVGKAGTKETTALLAASLASWSPHRIVKLTAPGDEYPDIGKSAVYICSDTACSAPVVDPAKVADEASATRALGR